MAAIYSGNTSRSVMCYIETLEILQEVTTPNLFWSQIVRTTPTPSFWVILALMSWAVITRQASFANVNMMQWISKVYSWYPKFPCQINMILKNCSQKLNFYLKSMGIAFLTIHLSYVVQLDGHRQHQLVLL